MGIFLDYSLQMTAIRELFPRPNISINEKALRHLIYGFACDVFEKDEFIPCRVFVDPDAYSMFNIVCDETGELIQRVSFYDIKSVNVD
jgi:hypothetical protein